VTRAETAAGPVPGPVLFARYAYPPNALGYCGPADSAALLGAADAGATGELAHLAARFEGAWPYLQLIAGCNAIDDPLDRRVVEAYWVGNTLLGNVPPQALVTSLTDRFERRAGRQLEPIVASVPLGGVAHHSFHVFAVYPWLGLLRAGRVEAALTVLDRCRIRWGEVVEVDGEWATVRSQLLRFDGSRLLLGDEQIETARCGRGGASLAPHLDPGDTVSLHWDWVCDRLTPAALSHLRACTNRNLAAVNALPAPGPAVAAEASGDPPPVDPRPTER
jgi:uncharacterized protein DUF6390